MYIIQAKDLYKKYGKTEAVKGVTLNINKGEIYGLLGPNGAGKSSLIKLITGIEKMDRGEIIFEEHEKEINKYKKSMGILTQDIAIYPNFTAYENISFFCSLYGFRGKELRQKVNESLKFVALEDSKHKKAGEFSGGMKRRLHLACAVAHNPKLVIMDEPTVGIDPQSRNHILESVKELKNKGTTVIYTSHYMEEVEEICDIICILDGGIKIAEGRKEHLKESVLSNKVYTIKLKNSVSKNIDQYLLNISGIEKIQIKDKEIKCYYSNKINILQTLVNTISNHGGVIESIKDEVPTLENVFLILTGKKLRD